MIFDLFFGWQFKSSSEVCKFIEEDILEKYRFQKDCKEIYQITVFFESPEAEEDFVAEYLRLRRYAVVGIAEQKELVAPFFERQECRGILVGDQEDAEGALTLAYRMIPDPCPTMEGVWDGTILLRRPTISTLTVISAGVINHNEAFVLVTTLIDPSRHLVVLLSAPCH